MNKINSIKNLTVITPFKGSNNIKLYETINCLYKQNLKICIQHLILYDFSSNNISEIKENFPDKQNYFLKFIAIQKKGIYLAINIGLDLLEEESHYIVIGAGDLIFFNNIEKIDIGKLLMCQYKLSNKNKNINILRSIYSGMPYCHNAIIFKVNHLRYSTKYLICADYDYFLKFIEYEKINMFTNDYFNNQINIIFESENGISSKSFFKKNIENLSVIYINLGYKYALFYLLLKTKKFFKKIYE